MSNLTIGFAPFVPWLWIAILSGLALALVLFTFWRGVSGGWLRLLTFAGLATVLANPSLIQEEREALDDLVLVMVDQSSSLAVSGKQNIIAKAADELGEQLAGLKNKDIRVLRFSDASTGTNDEGTRFKAALDRGLAEAPLNRLGAVIVLTDGQVHDLPEDQTDLGLPETTPLHVLVVGKRNEQDRVLRVNAAPRYGLVDETVEATIRIDDLGVDPDLASGVVSVEIRQEGDLVERTLVPTGQDLALALPVDKAGRNLFELSVEPIGSGTEEITLSNNRAVFQVNGVRERLSVLLVSGQPHQSERAWRNLLKSDPAVDLIHFTILRPAEKRDSTPVTELSLIPFPVHELFQVKLYDFDLIIFDHYPRRGILPTNYFGNIANYVLQGGALFVGAGPEFASAQTIYATNLSAVIPGAPTGIVKEQKFTPTVSALGKRHPVTSGLSRKEDPDWGSWMRQVELQIKDGQVLMSGLDGAPLLVSSRIGKGRVMQLASDNLWLWARGYEGGGPYTEVLRRSAHWLMGEPALEEEQLVASASNGKMRIERRSLGTGDAEVELVAPSGETQTVTLVDQPDGRALAEVEIDGQGVYVLRDEKLETRIGVGTLNPKELQDLRSSEALFQPFVKPTGGLVARLESAADVLPKARAKRPAKTMSGSASGRPWIGVSEHRATRLLGFKNRSLTPAILALLLLAGVLLWGWWRESK